MARLELRLLGRLEANLDGQPLEFPTRISALILSYLALSPGQRHARAKLAGLFWPDSAEEQARGSLRQAIFRLKRVLHLVDPPPVVSDTQNVWWDERHADVCDVHRFELALDATPPDLEAAVALFDGDLLAHVPVPDAAADVWLTGEQVRLRQRAGDAMRALAKRWAGARRLPQMEAVSRRLIALDPFDEDGHRHLMTALALQDRRSAAIAVYRKLAERLGQELNVAPDRETAALFETIRAGAAIVLDEVETRPSAPAALTVSHESTETSPADNDVDLGLAGRKHVTVLAAQLTGIDQMDPELAAEASDRFLDAGRTSAQRYGGTVTQAESGRMVALFGAPKVLEDDAVRACHAALGLQQRLGGQVAGVAMALCSGEIVMRPAAGEADALEAFGAPMTRALQLAHRVGSGVVALSEFTRQRIDGYFDTSPLSGTTMVGPSVGDAAFALGTSTGARNRWQAWLGRGLSAFVGRDTELADLRRAWQLVQQRQGQIVAIVGEPGVGKSRLHYEFLRTVDAGRVRILAADTATHDQDSVLVPIKGLLQAWVRIDDGVGATDAMQAVERALKGLDEALLGDLTPLLATLDLQVDDPGWHDLLPVQRRRMVIDALKRLMVRLSQDAPLIVVIEDLHWIDDETQAVLDGLASSLAAYPILLLVTFRPEYVCSWVARSYFRLIALGALSDESADALLRSRLGESGDLDGLRDELAARTAKVPLFLEESVRSLVEAGILEGDEGDRRLVGAASLFTLPPTIQAVIGARIYRLQPASREVLLIASVIGFEVPLAWLRAVVDLDEVALTAALADLQAAELIYEARILPTVEYRFKHALTHDVAYQSLLIQRRRQVHGQLVEFIERAYADRLDEHVERLAHHASHAELWREAARYLRNAGDRAVDRSAYTQARGYLERALDALARLPASPEVTRQTIDVLMMMRPVLIPIGHCLEALERLNTAETLAREINDRARLASIGLHKSYLLSTIGKYRPAVEEAERAFIVTSKLGDNRAANQAVLARCQALCLCGESRSVIEALEPLVVYWRDQHPFERFEQVGTRSIWCLGFLGFAYVQQGEFEKGFSYLDDGYQIAEQTGRPVDRWFAHHRRGKALTFQGELDESINDLKVGLSIIRDYNLDLFCPWILADLAGAYALAGQNEEAERLIEQGIGCAQQLHVAQHVALCELYLSLLVPPHRAVEYCRSSLSRANDAGEFLLATRATRYLGSALVEIDPEAACRTLSQAIRMCEEKGYRPELGHARFAKARALDRQGNVADAEREIAAARTLFADMGTQRWLSDVDAYVVGRPRL